MIEETSEAVPYYHKGRFVLMDYPARRLGEPRACPSRDFLVTQAVLNAVSKVYGATVELQGGVGGCLRVMGYHRASSVAESLWQAIRTEFAVLSERYC